MRQRLSWILLALLCTVPVHADEKEEPPKSLAAYRKFLIKSSTEKLKEGEVRVTFLGAASLLFDDGETQILTDGFFSRPPIRQILGRRIETDHSTVDKVMKQAKIDRLKAVFVAHTHYDHAFDVAYVCQKTKATLYGSSSALNIGRGGDLIEAQMVRVAPGKKIRVGKFTVTVLRGKHSPPQIGINNDIGELIERPLRQPASFREYKEGGSFDFFIERGDRTFLVSPATNYVPGALDKIRADVLFLATAVLAKQSRSFQKDYYEQTVGKVRPQLVIPIHWDNFFRPLSNDLVSLGDPAFDFLSRRLRLDGIHFGILQGYESITQ